MLPLSAILNYLASTANDSPVPHSLYPIQTHPSQDRDFPSFSLTAEKRLARVERLPRRLLAPESPDPDPDSDSEPRRRF